MVKNMILYTSIILLIASVVTLSVGCGSGPTEANIENPNTNQDPAADHLPPLDDNSDENIELSKYFLCNVDLVHEELGGQRVGPSDVKQYVIEETGDITVMYTNRADGGLDVVTMSMYYSGSYRAGNSAYCMFGCRLGDTSSDVRYQLLDYGFQPSYTSDDYEYLELYDGEWEVSYKCDNGFLNVMSVSCNSRTMAQAFQSELVSGYYVAALTGYSTKSAYIDKIYVADDNISIAFSGVFEKGTHEGAERELTDYTTFTVFPDDHTVYAGRGQYYSEDEFMNIIKSFNGLGMALTVDNGTLVKAELMS